MAEPKVITFDTCPGMKPDGTPCGSTRRLAEELAKEVKERHLMGLEEENYTWIVQKVVADQKKMLGMPIGVKVPAYTVKSDVCLDCGCIYAVKVIITEWKLHPDLKIKP